MNLDGLITFVIWMIAVMMFTGVCVVALIALEEYRAHKKELAGCGAAIFVLSLALVYFYSAVTTFFIAWYSFILGGGIYLLLEHWHDE